MAKASGLVMVRTDSANPESVAIDVISEHPNQSADLNGLLPLPSVDVESQARFREAEMTRALPAHEHRLATLILPAQGQN